ncbi:MAG: hypothetical protein DIU79_14900, partial [Actinobacteria bacterium]
MKLVAEVLDYAPATLSPAERLVLIVLAESANDKTREAWPSMDVITRRCGMSDRGVRAVFKRLAKRKLEVRVPLGKDKNGRPVYSHPGKRTTYRLPVFAGTTVPPFGENGGTPVPPNGGTTVPPFGENGGTPVPEWRHSRSGMAEPPFRPPLNEPSKNPH